jgi:hypothetical protein
MTGHQLALPFGGVTYERDVDGRRLARQLAAVRAVMLDGDWHTLAELHDVTGAPESSASARVRDLRKPAFGGYVVESRRRRPGRGTWEYRVVEVDT